MSKTETFSNSIHLALIKEYDKVAVMQIEKLLWQVYHAACQMVL